MYVCVCVYITYIQAFTSAHVLRSEVNVESSSIAFSPCFFETRSLTERGTHQWARLLASNPRGPPVSSELGSQTCTLTPGSSRGCQGCKPRSSRLNSKYFTNWAASPSPGKVWHQFKVKYHYFWWCSLYKHKKKVAIFGVCNRSIRCIGVAWIFICSNIVQIPYYKYIFNLIYKYSKWNL